MPGVHDKHRSRVKDEFRKLGLEHFPPHKVLEMLLYYTIRRADTNELAHRLIDRFGSVSGVLDAPYDMLMEVKGIGEESATMLKLTAGVIKCYMDDYTGHKNLITDAKSAKEYMRYKFLGEQRECVYLACLGTMGKLLSCARIAEGSPETVNIVPSEVIKAALRANASKVVLAHNHPDGMCIPSSKDLRATNLLHSELLRVDVELADHIIVAADGEYSMAENGMMGSHR